MNFNVLPSDVLQAAAATLNKIFKANKDRNFLFLSSGGSSLALLDLIETENFGPNSTVCVLDERYSTDPKINNFSILKATNFYPAIKNRNSNFIDTSIKNNESLDELANRFDSELKHWLQNVIGIIIATIGIGSDAHVGGIMPHPENPDFFEKTFNNPETYAAGYDAKNKNPYPLRISVTMPFFRKIDKAVVYATGDSKRQPLRQISELYGSLAQTPCRILREMKDVEVFTDISV